MVVGFFGVKLKLLKAADIVLLSLVVDGPADLHEWRCDASLIVLDSDVEVAEDFFVDVETKLGW